VGLPTYGKYEEDLLTNVEYEVGLPTDGDYEEDLLTDGEYEDSTDEVEGGVGEEQLDLPALRTEREIGENICTNKKNEETMVKDKMGEKNNVSEKRRKDRSPIQKDRKGLRLRGNNEEGILRISGKVKNRNDRKTKNVKRTDLDKGGR
jgi:hypothetical protein